MGREEAKAQAKEAANAQAEANRVKNQARKDKVWAVGAKDNSKQQDAADKAAATAARKAAAKKQLEDEGGVIDEPAQIKAKPANKKTKCKGCGKFNIITKKKPCPNCTLGK